MELHDLVKIIREASYDYWYDEHTLGCDTRGLAPAKAVAKALIDAGVVCGPT